MCQKEIFYLFPFSSLKTKLRSSLLFVTHLVILSYFYQFLRLSERNAPPSETLSSFLLRLERRRLNRSRLRISDHNSLNFALLLFCANSPPSLALFSISSLLSSTFRLVDAFGAKASPRACFRSRFRIYIKRRDSG